MASPEFGMASPEFGMDGPEFGMDGPESGRDGPESGRDGLTEEKPELLAGKRGFLEEKPGRKRFGQDEQDLQDVSFIVSLSAALRGRGAGVRWCVLSGNPAQS